MRKSTFLIAGKHAVTEALKNPSRKVLKIFLTEDSKKDLNKSNKWFYWKKCDISEKIIEISW